MWITRACGIASPGKVSCKTGDKAVISLLREYPAACELLFFPDVPVKVTINEAVELAKKYATTDDASYINGVLGRFVKNEEINKDSEDEGAIENGEETKDEL